MPIGPQFMIYSMVSILIYILLIILFFMFVKKHQAKRTLKLFFLISLPVIIFYQVYCWNVSFHNYVTSFLLVPKYECNGFVLEMPYRSVLDYKTNVCSFHFRVYRSEKKLKKYFLNEVKQLKKEKKITKYSTDDNLLILFNDNMRHEVKIKAKKNKLWKKIEIYGIIKNGDSEIIRDSESE